MADLFTFCDELRRFRNGAANRLVSVAMTYVDTEGRMLVYSGLVASDRNFMGRPDEILFTTKGALVLGPQLAEAPFPFPFPAFGASGPAGPPPESERNLEAFFNFVPRAGKAADGMLRGAGDPPAFEMKVVDLRLEGSLVEARAEDVLDSRFVISFRKHIKGLGS